MLGRGFRPLRQGLKRGGQALSSVVLAAEEADLFLAPLAAHGLQCLEGAQVLWR